MLKRKNKEISILKDDKEHLGEFLKESTEEIERLNKCYCERTDCSGRIKNSKKYESMQEEIERLNNLLKETSQTLSEQTTKAITLKSENERLQSIIKEVREYIENNTYFEGNAVKTMIYQDYSKGIIEILEKENK